MRDRRIGRHVQGKMSPWLLGAAPDSAFLFCGITIGLFLCGVVGCESKSENDVEPGNIEKRIATSLADWKFDRDNRRDPEVQRMFDQVVTALKSTSPEDLSTPAIALATVQPPTSSSKAELFVTWIADKPEANGIQIRTPETVVQMALPKKDIELNLQVASEEVTFAAWLEIESGQWEQVKNSILEGEATVALTSGNEVISEQFLLSALDMDSATGNVALSRKLENSVDLVTNIQLLQRNPMQRELTAQVVDALNRATEESLSKPTVVLAAVQPRRNTSSPLQEGPTSVLLVNWIANKPQANGIVVQNGEQQLKLPMPQRDIDSNADNAQSDVMFFSFFEFKPDSQHWRKVKNMLAGSEASIALAHDGEVISDYYPITVLDDGDMLPYLYPTKLR